MDGTWVHFPQVWMDGMNGFPDFSALNKGMRFMVAKTMQEADGFHTVEVDSVLNGTAIFSSSDPDQSTFVMVQRDWDRYCSMGYIRMFSQDVKMVEKPSFFIPEIIPHHADDMAHLIYDLLGKQDDVSASELMDLCLEHDKQCGWPDVTDMGGVA